MRYRPIAGSRLPCSTANMDRSNRHDKLPRETRTKPAVHIEIDQRRPSRNRKHTPIPTHHYRGTRLIAVALATPLRYGRTIEMATPAVGNDLHDDVSA